MRISRCVVAVVGGLALAAGVQAAERKLRFGHLTAEDGLSHPWVYSVLKDSRGFLWFGTADGLDRYDGATITSHRYRPNDPHGLASPRVGSLLEDSRQRLWVGSFWNGAGLARYDRDSDTFHYYPTKGPNSLAATGVNVMREDREGVLWLGTENGLRSFDSDRGAFTLHRLDVLKSKDPAAGHVDAILFDRHHNLWVGTGAGLVRREHGASDFVLFPLQADGAGALYPDVMDICEDDAGTLWIATLGAGLVRLDPVTGRSKRYLPIPNDPTSLGHSNVSRLALGRPGTLYVGTENGGLNVLDVAKERFARFLPDPDDATAINSASIWSLLVDDQGILWIGTFNGGVDFVSPFGQRFGLIRAGRGQLSDPHVTAVLEDSAGVLWIGTDGGGLNRLDRKTGRVTYYRHDPLDAQSLGSDAVIMLHEDGRKRLWVGTWGGGLSLFDPRKGRFTHNRHVPGDPSTIINDSPWCILEEGEDRFLVGTEGGGVDIFDTATRKFSRLAASYPGLPADGYVHGIARDPLGNLWLAMSQGIGHVDVRTRQTATFMHDPADPGSVARGAVRSVLVDSRGNAWFGLEGGGLACAPANGTRIEFRRYTTDEGLPGNGVLSIIEDAAGNLWLGTDRGLSRFENALSLPARPRFLNFDVHDGLPGLAFRFGASYRSRRGELFFGGQRGLTRFFPADIVENPAAPAVVLTGLKIFNRPAVIGERDSPLEKAISETRRLTLSHRHSVVTFEFAALNFVLPEKNQYAYKLEGFDRDWSYVGTQRSATYTNLPPGDYVLRVRGSNNDGVWSQRGASLEIHVLPPFWRTWWFRLALAAALVLGFGAAYGTRMSALRRRERVLEQRVEERTAALRQEIAERERAETALKESEERYALAARGTNDGIWDWDLSTDRIYFSPRWKEILGYGGAEIQDQPDEWLGRVHPEDVARLRHKLEAHRRGTAAHFQDEHRVRHRDGGFRWVLSRGFAVRNAEGVCERLVGALSDVTERRVYDPLTGLPNRTLFLDRLSYVLSLGREHGNARSAVLLLDLDRFTRVNDSLGHLMGDQLLVDVSRRIERCLRPSDLLARLGGDEFGVLIDDTGSDEDAVDSAERIAEALRAPCRLADAEVFVTATTGIALATAACPEAEELLRDAGTALHRAKAQGPGRVVVFDSSMRIAAVETLRFESALRRALEHDELCLYYQPIVSLASGELVGFEALARWQHPERGLILPSEFIPLAEKTGLIAQLGRQALHTACRQLREWQLHSERARAISVSVNISPRQFTRPELIGEIRSVLDESQLPPQHLRLEITESALLEGDDRVLAMLARLRELHVAVDVDDFGTGYSSLRYLQQLPMDALKIDRLFVQRMGQREDSLAIVQTVLNLARRLGLAAVAEGVETRQQLEHLKDLGCHRAQGFLISEAVTPEAARNLIEAPLLLVG
jgi:diguanylate cyclase (GGDEF)-like protein/PAS domain S-box-containing protein